jgi:hypothetical protein
MMRSSCLLIALLTLQVPAGAADSEALKGAIAKGLGFLESQVMNQQGARRTLTVLAMYKAGIPKDSPLVKETVNEIVSRCQGETYVPGGDHIYQAGVEATFLADLDAQAHRAELSLLRDYLIKQQLENGGWDYPQGHGPGCNGDTSVTQYACLGLWAAARSGLEVEPEIWLRVINWHMEFQNADGGFAYCPKFGNDTSSTLNMSAAGIGSLHVAMLHLDPTLIPLGKAVKEKEAAKAPPKFGVLEKLVIDGPAQPKTAAIPAGAIGSVRKAFGWLEPRFRVENKGSYHNTYYYYTLERMAALANVKMIGGHDWFNECADYLLTVQKPDGSWKESAGFNELLDTDFCMLFLTRSTGKTLKRIPHEELFGDGTLAGGRGLPDDLSETRFNGRQVMSKDQPVQPLDLLLASLQNTGSLDVDQVQEQIVEQIQLGDRQELVGQVDRLLKLIHNPSAEVRRVAVWAIGRSDRMDLVPVLINALDDPDLGVIIEARNALCWLSRKPNGFGNAEDPLRSLPPDATDQQKKDTVASWHRSLVLAWGEWCLQNRPFDQRGDEFEARLRAKMRQLRQRSSEPEASAPGVGDRE